MIRTLIKFIFLIQGLLIIFESKSQSDSLRDLTIQFGLDFRSLNTEKYSFEEFRSHFPFIAGPSQDFSSYHFDSTFEHFGIAPLCVRLDYGYKANLGKHKLVKNAVYRFMIEFNRSEMYYQNFLKEESNGDYMVMDTVHRDYYSFEWNQRVVSFIFGLQFNSRYLFKRKRGRAWIGFYFSNGIGSGYIRKVHSIAQSPGKYTGNIQGVDQYEYSGPSYYYYQNVDSWDIGKYFMTGYHIPVGYEHLFGRNKNFGLGFQFLFGHGLVLLKDNTIPISLGGLMYNLRFIIN